MEMHPLDLAPITTRHLRAMARSRLLVTAVHHIPVFETLQEGPLAMADLQERLKLKGRPAMVLFPALCAIDLLLHPQARATVFDRPAVLAVTKDLLAEFGRRGRAEADRVGERVTFLAGDMLNDELPPADLVLAASLFHDWPVETCQRLAQKFAAALLPGGELWVHDSFLNDTLDGPLVVPGYSALLFLKTRGGATAGGNTGNGLSGLVCSRQRNLFPP